MFRFFALLCLFFFSDSLIAVDSIWTGDANDQNWDASGTLRPMSGPQLTNNGTFSQSGTAVSNVPTSRNSAPIITDCCFSLWSSYGADISPQGDSPFFNQMANFNMSFGFK